ncbi:hypothetical protein [Longibacter sp.]|uniref:hypothetical protein n=1 Tax=Longibacter sp. TaxID=2045415 RepID=UPI003EB99987
MSDSTHMRSAIALLAAALLVLIPSTVMGQTAGIGAGGQIGVSNAAPSPVGLTVKGWTSDRQAFQGAMSFVIGGDGPANSYLILQGDYLFHNFEQVSVGDGLMALYVGPGLQLTFIENRDTNVALRAPLGVSYMLGDAPIDVFAEVAPTLQVASDAQLRFDGAIGFRYYF